ncbi:MAG: methionine--tRNA ligase subunit beta [Candidatus Sungbacteria bacterium]|nr:methionine--tRNA ligase subunit beta [Candidatus Sungbacteria bacterium]
MIFFDEFKKLDLRVGKVLSAERIGNSEKLLKLRVDLGSEERQIIAGIGKKYEPETLIGREIIVVANLEPKIIMGLASQGMLLAANTEEGPVLLRPEKEVAPGTEIR